jgi:predicted nucleic acid-binding protein
MPSRSPVVAIDSQVLVWGIRTEGTPEQLQRAKWLFQQLEGELAQILVPSVAISEYLVRVKPEDHAGTLASLSERFIIAPFDARCASRAAQLFLEGKDDREMGVNDARKTLRADCMIIATAIAFGATRFYSGDEGCRKLAGKWKRWIVEDMPSQGPTLFD